MQIRQAWGMGHEIDSLPCTSLDTITYFKTLANASNLHEQTASYSSFASMILAPGTDDDVAPFQGHRVNDFKKMLNCTFPEWQGKHFESTQVANSIKI